MVLALLCAPAALAGDTDDTLDPLVVYRRYHDHPSGATRLQAVRQLEGVRGTEAVAALVASLSDADGRVRATAARLLCHGLHDAAEVDTLQTRVRGSRSVEARMVAVTALFASLDQAPVAAARGLSDAAEDKSVEVRRHLADEIRRHEPTRHEALIAALSSDRDPLVRADALLLAALAGSATAAPDALASNLDSPAAEIRVAALAAWRDRVRVEDVDVISDCLDDRCWSVRVAAAEALGSAWGEPQTYRAAVAALIATLPAEPRLRVRHAIGVALFQLTAIDFGPEPERWTRWWSEDGARYPMPQSRPTRPKRAVGGTRSTYLDVPIESDRVCFVLDDSHSMLDPLQFGSDRLKRDVLREAVGDALERLPKGSEINVIPFGTEPAPFKRRLFRLGAGARKAVMRFLAKHPSDGRTNLFDSLAIAFDDAETDTLVVVTDGAPSEGVHTTRTAILDAVRRLNRYRRIRIHTVEVGADRTSRRWRGFLRELATENSGTYLAR